MSKKSIPPQDIIAPHQVKFTEYCIVDNDEAVLAKFDRLPPPENIVALMADPNNKLVVIIEVTWHSHSWGFNLPWQKHRAFLGLTQDDEIIHVKPTVMITGPLLELAKPDVKRLGAPRLEALIKTVKK